MKENIRLALERVENLDDVEKKAGKKNERK